jgi:alkylated DNA repair dioxygenase AlkB
MARSTRLDPAADLFAAEALPEGLTYRPDFISPREEAELLEQIRALPLVPAPYRQYTARRRVASFGSTYDFQAQRLNEAPPLPPFLLPLRARIAGELKVLPDELAQGLVTAYDIGTPLGWHRDAPEFGSVAGVSLAGSCEMRWRQYPPRVRRTLLRLTVAARSLYLITGEARWGWQHSVAPTRELRYSITFRTLRERPRARQT